MEPEERIVVPREGSAALACDIGVVTVSAAWGGNVRVDFGAEAGSVMRRITTAVELFDGDLVAAGRQWMSFQAGRNGHPARLHLLDEMGSIRLTLTLRGESMSLGREVGDVVLPQDDSLSELHLQLLVRHGRVFVQDLASGGGTWVVARSGELLPSDSVLAIGGRRVRVSTPLPVEPTAAEPEWPTGVFVAA